ncbi:MAG: hypothetical protein K2J20_02240 [Bacilli bacterium]|nr:hypothetical protein [Bacilli bacterium]
MLLAIRIIAYLAVFISYNYRGVWKCSSCYIGEKVCIGGYGGFDLKAILEFIGVCIIIELIFLFIESVNKKYGINKFYTKALMIVLIILSALKIFSNYYFSNYIVDEWCHSCFSAFCNDDYSICKVIIDDKEYNELNCSSILKSQE